MSTNTGGVAPNYPSLLRLDGRGFVVLGAGQGIGEQAVHALAQARGRAMCGHPDGQPARSIPGGAESARRQVRINAVAPGYVRTPRLNQRLGEEAWDAISKVIPIGRPATPAEIAGPLLFLASDLSAHMTGEVMAVDGGAGVMAAFPDVKFGPAASITP